MVPQAFVITDPRLMTILALKLVECGTDLSYRELLETLVMAYYIPENNRWLEIKEDVLETLLTSTLTSLPENDYQLCDFKARTIVCGLETAYPIMAQVLDTYVPSCITTDYVFTHLTCNRKGFILFYSRQEIF